MSISFETITNSGDKSILCNLSKLKDEILEVQSGRILKSLESSTIKQEDKGLYRRIRGQIKRLGSMSSPRTKSLTLD